MIFHAFPIICDLEKKALKVLWRGFRGDNIEKIREENATAFTWLRSWILFSKVSSPVILVKIQIRF